jgi:hypothetical protein
MIARLNVQIATDTDLGIRWYLAVDITNSPYGVNLFPINLLTIA